MVRLTGFEPTRRLDTSTSSWPVYQFQHSRESMPKKDCLIIIARSLKNVNLKFPFSANILFSSAAPAPEGDSPLLRRVCPLFLRGAQRSAAGVYALCSSTHSYRGRISFPPPESSSIRWALQPEIRATANRGVYSSLGRPNISNTNPL